MEGTSDFNVQTCSDNENIGIFYVCYSKNLSELEKLNVDNQHCCYCSEKAVLTNCSQRFPNWKIDLAGGHKSFCRVTLREVTKNDSGYYQCRVYDVDYYPCKHRNGYTYNYSVSISDHSSSKIHLKISLSTSCGMLVIIMIIAIALTYYCWKHKKSSFDFQECK